MVDYDVVVVGAGPAGAVAARGLAIGGARVALLESEPCPRSKICAGGLSPRARERIEAILGQQWRQAILSVVHRVVVSCRGSAPTTFAAATPLWHTVNRPSLDAMLAKAAAAAGATVHFQWPVVDVQRSGTRWLVLSTRNALRTKAVIGADGVQGVVASSTRLRRHHQLTAALLASLPLPEHAPELASEAWLDHGAAPYGFAWMFPSGNEISVGISGLVEVPGLRKLLKAFLAHRGLGAGATRPQNWMLPVWTPHDRASAGNVLLVGDAAGFSDPLTGEGIFFAVRTAELAASSLLQGDFGPESGVLYEQALHWHLRRDLLWGRTLARSVGTVPELAQSVLAQHPATFHWLQAVANGEADYRNAVLRIAAQWVGQFPGLPVLGAVRPAGATVTYQA